MGGGSGRGLSPRDLAIAILPGVFVGFLAGLVGLGGAEERMPFLLYGLGLPLYEMLAANLIVSLMTSGINFALRAQVGLFTPSTLLTAGAMIIGSVPGAYFGAVASHKVSARKLKAVIAVVLSVVLVKLSTDAVFGSHASTIVLPVEVSLPLAIILGAGVGVVSGMIGVAGGEYRIPLLIFVFGMSIKLAGTASQLVSLPTIIIALAKHVKFGVPSRRSLALAGIMGVSSVAGVVLSTSVLVNAGENTIRLVFAGILLYTILRIVNELRAKVL
ncbi:MAG: sulfite exporter TauE/SafE family protein [Nitrososphaerales archaeon]|nr:sulfite exporter TauE/SafE family protein [Nitrososphaerales archaeon]